MPTLTAASLDHLLEPEGASRSSPSSSSMEAVKKNKYNTSYPSPINSRLERSNTAPLRPEDVNFSAKKADIPPPPPRQLRRRNSTAPERRTPTSSSRPPISPSLYTTPESTPLPDSPTSPFPPLSPYVINHKRRGPRLIKSLSEKHVAAAAERRVDEVDGRFYNGHFRRLSEETMPRELKEEPTDENVANEMNGSKGDGVFAQKDESGNGASGDVVDGGSSDLKILTRQGSTRSDGEAEDFFDPAETMSYMSYTDGEDYGGDQSARMYTPMGDLYTPKGEFYDAPEDLSSESVRQPRRSLFNTEIELREMRLNLLMEIEKRKQAEDALNSMRSQWQRFRERLTTVGLNLPAELPGLLEDNQSDADPLEDICQQVHVTRFVSESIGRAAAKAETEDEMSAQLEVKNFEIARLSDRLHYYETMNREMSQRNQEAIEITRRERQKRRRRQEWMWGSIGAAITLGSAALVCAFIPGGKGSSSTKTDSKPQ